MNKIKVNTAKEIRIEDNNRHQIIKEKDKEDIIITIAKDKTPILDVLSVNTNNNITYYLEENAKVEVNKLVIDNSDHIKIYLKKGSKINYNYSSINYKRNIYHIEVFHEDKNTTSIIRNHGVNINNEDLVFKVDGSILKNCKDCICKQDNKIISMKDNHAEIKPNLMIDNDEIEAEHSAYIGKLDDEELFYLMSRGIKKNQAKNLLLKAFLLGDIQIEDERFLNIINSIGGE